MPRLDGSVKHLGLDNHGMVTIFEEPVRRFNEEAGEHWIPRDAVRLIANRGRPGALHMLMRC